MAQEENQETNVKSTIDAVTGLLKAVPIYQDALQPAAQEIGKSLATVTKTVNIALAPIKALVWGYEKIEEYLTNRVSEKLKNVSVENITSPPPHIAGPAVEALRYSGHDENLRELYANLVATAMDKNTTDKAHPGYVEIIKNLSSEEALLLQAFAKRNSYPIININYSGNDDPGYIIFYPSYTHLYKVVRVRDINKIPIYVNNLCRLGILESNFNISLSAPNTYEPLENSQDLNLIKEQIAAKNKTLSFDRGIIGLTSFGKEFVYSVVVEK